MRGRGVERTDRDRCAARTAPGVRYTVPKDVLGALERLFDQPGLGRIAVIYRPLYVRGHLLLIGGRVGSVTRPERIFTNVPEALFFTLDRHVVHEYYHVVQQWGRERMTRVGYLLNSGRREREAHEFVAANIGRYRRYRWELHARGTRWS